MHVVQPCSLFALPLAVLTEPITGDCMQFAVKGMYRHSSVSASSDMLCSHVVNLAVRLLCDTPARRRETSHREWYLIIADAYHNTIKCH
ncbi:hypothetical protein EDB86DRAFT_1872815 [Lactarius hatsudake]|nr:hypothetical protein EDB86DRAFT_1872815 [Lactarius hatsudake]